MLTIRPEQLEVFQPVAEAAFERRVVEYLRGHHADEGVILPTGGHEVKDIDDKILLKMVRTGIARARSYGMTWESSITAFVVLMFTIAPNFDEHPLIQRVLKNEEIEPDSRFDRLWESITEENWQAAAQSYESTKWELHAKEE